MRKRVGRVRGTDLVRRLQDMLYEYHDLGRFDEARPHILWLMEIAEKDGGKPAVPHSESH
jgi:hypothetical protein